MTPTSPAETWTLDYDNHGNGSFSEWWEIRGPDEVSIGRAYTEEAGRDIIGALSARCPNPSLHTVEGAPIQALADLLRTATEVCDETANDSWCASVQMHDATQTDCACGYVALRAAVRTLNGSTTGRFSNG